MSTGSIDYLRCGKFGLTGMENLGLIPDLIIESDGLPANVAGASALKFIFVLRRHRSV